MRFGKREYAIAGLVVCSVFLLVILSSHSDNTNADNCNIVDPRPVPTTEGEEGSDCSHVYCVCEEDVARSQQKSYYEDVQLYEHSTFWIGDGLQYTDATVLLNHESYWGKIREYVLSVVGSGVTYVPDIWRRVMEFELSPSMSFSLNRQKGQFLNCPMLGRSDLTMSYEACLYGGRVMFYHKIATSVPETFDTFVELGSGWGRNIFGLLSHGILSGKKVYSGEFSAAGCEVQRIISAVVPKNALDLTVFRFNYTDPGLQLIRNEKPKSVVVITVHSIEQVEKTPTALWEEILSLGDEVYGMHLEPISAQHSCWEKSKADPDACVVTNPQSLHYNSNMYSQLLKLEESGRIKILESVSPYYWHGSLVAWKKLIGTG